MQNTQEKLFQERSSWFKKWFDSAYYHKLYANRDEKEAKDFIDALIRHLQPRKDATMLDIGCGVGRHCKYLAAKGFDVTGMDLSQASISEAKKMESPSLHFYRHDMRRPFGNNQFNYAFNFFTSFGYFNDQHENNLVISNMANALKPCGTLVIDYMNHHYAEARLIAEEEKEIDGIHYYIKRWADERFIYKKISIDVAQWGEPMDFVEKVAKFSVEDFQEMLTMHNLELVRTFGDYQLNNYDRYASSRLILVAKKTSKVYHKYFWMS